MKFLGLMAAGMMLAGPALAQKPTIRSAADLPPTRFQLAEPPSAALTSAALISDTLPRLRTEAERIRATYDIQDQALAQQMRDGLAAIAVLQGRSATARALIAESRAASAKPQQKAVGMLVFDAAAAIVDGPKASGCRRGATRIAALLDAAEPAVVRSTVLANRAGLEVLAEPFVVGILRAETDGGAAADGQRIGLADAIHLATYRMRLDVLVPCRTELSTAIQRWAARPNSRPANIWTAREPGADALARTTPVVVAVWDSGYDQTLFPGQLAADPKEPIDGRDNDRNGIVDDWNGPTYDARMNPDAAPVKRASAELSEQLAFQYALSKGATDLISGLDTADARLFAQRSREASPADQEMDALLWNEVRGRNHGTSVASEIADGNAFVRLFSISAEPWGNDPREVVVDEALNDRWIAAVDRLPAKLRSAKVRVVNMSWGYTVDEIADKLQRYGGVTDQAVAVSRAKAMWTKADAAMRRLLAATPDILYVNSAGNSDQTDEILASTPQVTGAPNLLVVGATDTAGLPTGFTTYGKGVGIYAWGEDVPLRVPGGQKTFSSGTSMSAPLVARAAAQMLAVNPKLTPTKLIAGLKATATGGGDAPNLLHPANAVAWAKAN